MSLLSLSPEWSLVQLRTWNFGRRWRCWRTPIGGCGRKTVGGVIVQDQSGRHSAENGAVPGCSSSWAPLTGSASWTPHMHTGVYTNARAHITHTWSLLLSDWWEDDHSEDSIRELKGSGLGVCLSHRMLAYHAQSPQFSPECHQNTHIHAKKKKKLIKKS